MRCIACNKRLEYPDLAVRKEDGTEEDMCWKCIGKSYTEYQYVIDHEYVCDPNPVDLIQESNLVYEGWK